MIRQPAYPSLKDRVVLITGAGRGVGRTTALAFAEQGARLVLTAGRNAAELERTVAEANAIAEGCCEGLLADVGSPDDVARVAALAQERFGRVDVLINNAARSPKELDADFFPGCTIPFWDTTPEGFRLMMEANLFGPFLMTRAVVGGMIERGFGRIINTSTSRRTLVRSGMGPYGPLKAALEAFTVIWARDLTDKGVTVNAILPGGATDTAMMPGDDIGRRAVTDFKPGPEHVEGAFSVIMPTEIMVGPSLWLASDDSADCTGRRIVAMNWDPAKPARIALEDSATPPVDLPQVI